MQPLRIPQKSLSSLSDDGSGKDGFTFGNMMQLMMVQNRMDQENRDQEYQLRRDEMAMVHGEAREQRQMMNLMFMAMLNKSIGSDSNHSNPQPPPQ
jgi:hypothetical protein